MTRDIIPIKWIIGAIALLIIIAGACYLWYQHSLAADRKAAADAQQLLRQSEIERQAKQKAATAKTESAKAPADSTTPTAEKSVNKVTAEVENNTEAKTGQQSASPAKTTDAADVPVSPFGFGPYPKVPEDYPSKHLVEWPEATPQKELLSRVLIKLWTNGEKNFRGGSTGNGKVYPHYNDVVYVRFAEYRKRDGKVVRYAARTKSGPQVSYTEADLLNPPPHLRILDLDTSGIDPYEYLNLP